MAAACQGNGATKRRNKWSDTTARMAVWYNKRGAPASQEWGREWTERLSPGNRHPGISRHSFSAPNSIRKEKDMPIRGSIKALKEAPRQAVNLGIIAILISLTALLVALGKRK